MTVSANYSREFQRNEILRRALNKAGLLTAGKNPSSTHPAVQQAADFLEMEVDHLQSEGHIATSVELKTLSLTQGTTPATAITLPADTLDVIGTAMLITSSTGAEQAVEPMSESDWMLISQKTATGTPTRYYAKRGLTVSLYLDPGVGGTGWSLRYRQVRLFRDADSGTVTMDLQRHWVAYLVAEVAHQLAVANAIPTERCAYLRSDARELKKSALAYSRPRGPTQMHVNHRGPWR